MRCTITRWQLSNALDRGELAARVARGHAARCVGCQGFARDLQQLHARLALGADRAPAVAATAPARPRWPLLAGGLIAAAAAGAAAIELRTPAAPSEPVALVAPRLPVAEFAARMKRTVDRIDSPLDRELAAIVDDGKRGLDAVLATGALR